MHAHSAGLDDHAYALRRWAADSRSCVDIVQGSIATSIQNDNVEDMETLMRFNTANSEVNALERLKIPLSPSTSVAASVMNQTSSRLPAGEG